MLEENKDIDNLFKSVVEPYKMDPPEKVWTSLDGELISKRAYFTAGKGYFGFKFLSITVAAVVLSFVAYQMLTPSSYYKTRKTQENPAQAVQEKVSNSPSSVDENVKASLSETSDNSGSVSTISKDQSGEGAKQINTTENNLASSNAGNGTANNARTSQNADDGNIINNNSQTGYLKNNSSNAASTSQSGNAEGAGSMQGAVDANNSNSSNNNNSTNSETSAIQSSSQTGSSQASVNSSQPVNENEEAKTAEADERAKSVSDSTSDLNENSAEDDAANLSLLSLKQTKRHFSIDAFYSPDIVEGTSSTNNTSATQSIATTNTEKFNLSFNTGAMLRYDLNDRWSISIGCTYSTLNYSTSLTTSYVVTTADSGNGGGNHGWGFPKNPTDTALSQHFNDPNFFNNYFPYSPSTNTFNYNNNLGSIQLHGNPVLSPPSSSNQPGEVVYFTTNANMILQYINIPLTVSYKISNRRFDYYLSGGASIDFLVYQQATVNIADAYSETTNDITGLRKTNYDYLVSAGVRYHLYKGISIFIEPAFRGALTPITTAPSNSFYPYYFGLNTGVSVHF